MTSPSDEVFPGAAAWAEVAELNQRLYDARARIRELEEAQLRTASFIVAASGGRVRVPRVVMDEYYELTSWAEPDAVVFVSQALTPEKRDTP